MAQKPDTTKIQLISDDYKVLKKNDNIIVIEQKDKSENSKSFYETPLFLSLFFPIVISLCGFFIARWWFRLKEKKENEKLEVEVEKIREDIRVLKKSFQPIVLSTIQLTQEKLINDKILALKELASFRYKFFAMEQDYIQGQPFIEDTFEYHQSVYGKVNETLLNDLKEIVLKKGFLFPKGIKDNMNLLIYELSDIYEIQKREYSSQIQEMPNEVIKILERLSEKLNIVIDDIRTDLHIDNSFIHDFIEKYKDL
ncbi:hypothetical protein ACH3O9_14735 [Leeuwenhoekiella sp. A16]|uniref:hypothetical protein n=1 Tax=unclassified Leeuwenhoekiella TaxID=2615029 RepID=UPI003A80ABB0